MNHPISCVMIVKNGERLLQRSLESLRDFPEVIVVDTGSTDRTMEIARSFPNVVLHERSFKGFGPSKQEAVALASHDWVLCIDSDEWLLPETTTAILSLPLHSESLYRFPRKNFYRGRHIRCCGWHPDRVTRLFHRQYANYDDSPVHEKVIPLSACNVHFVDLPHPMAHHPYIGIAHFLGKMQHYSALYADQHQGKKSTSPTKAFLRAGWMFFRNYFLQRGCLCGYPGFLISVYNASTTFWKHLTLYEKNNPE